MTHAEIGEQLARASFEQYARSMLRIEDDMGQLVSFELNDPQKIVYREIKRQEEAGRPVRMLLLKGRRQGMSTLAQMRISWKLFTQPGIRCHTVAHNLALTHELYGKFARSHKSLPDFLRPSFQPGGDKGRRQQLDDTKDPNGGADLPGGVYRADSAADPESVGRGTGIMVAHFTEVPQWANPEETMQAVLSTVPDKPGTEMYIETTAKGATGWFYEQWVDSMRSINRGEEPEFVPVFIPWFKTKHYRRKRRKGEPTLDKRERDFRDKYGLDNDQVHWYRDQKQRYGEKVTEEFPSHWEEAFLSSGRPFFLTEHLKHYRGEMRQPDKKGQAHIYTDTDKAAFKIDEYGPTHIFCGPTDGHRYSLGVDFASGRAGDYNTICVLSADGDGVVATHKSKMLPQDVLSEAIYLGRVYNDALLIPDRTGMGQTLVDILANDTTYPNIYRETDPTRVKYHRGVRFGWAQTANTRKAILEEMASKVHRREFPIPCQRLIEEMFAFIYTDAEGKRAEAASGHNDDLIMAFAMAVRGLSSLPLPPTKKKPPKRTAVISRRSGY